MAGRDWMQRVLDHLGGALEHESLALTTPDGGRWQLGRGPVRATIRLADRAVLRRILRSPVLAFGETYMEGAWEVEGGTLDDVLAVAQRFQAAQIRGGKAHIFRRLYSLLARSNTLARARRHVAHHYDLGTNLYRAFLDQDLHYSCAYFREPSMPLEAAQQAKCAHIAAKLALEPGARVLDIGAGFGSFALYLAEHHDARVTAITLSKDQLEVAQQRIRARGLEDKVEMRLADYREVEGQYDAIVSIGMFEHVGLAQYKTFFRKLHALLAERGTALLHTIGMLSPAGQVNPWLRKYIFPGGHLPSACQLTAAIEHSRLKLCDLEVWRHHYAYTLAEWRRRFEAAWPKLEGHYDARFKRMWRFYLVSAQTAFLHRDLVVFQAQLAHRLDRLPVTRDYLYRY